MTRRRVSLAELGALPDPRVRAVVEPLAAARLLTLDAAHVEVAHEALFREWPRLRTWLAEHVAARTVQRHLASAAASWDDAGRDPTELWRGGRAGRRRGLLRCLPAGGDDSRTGLPRRRPGPGGRRAPGGRSPCRGRSPAESETAGVAGGDGRPPGGRPGGRRARRPRRLACWAGGAGRRGEGVGGDGGREPAIRPGACCAAGDASSGADPRLRRGRASPGGRGPPSLGRVVTSGGHVPGPGGAVAWSPDGSMVVTEGPEGTGLVDVRDPQSGRSLRAWHGHDIDVNDVDSAPTGRWQPWGTTAPRWPGTR